MRTVTFYEAFDGRRFKTEDECQEHENFLKSKSGLVLESVAAYIKKHPYLGGGSKAGKLRAIEWIKCSFGNSLYGCSESDASDSSDPCFEEEAENLMSVLLLCRLVGNCLIREENADTASIDAYIRDKTSVNSPLWTSFSLAVDSLVELIFAED